MKKNYELLSLETHAFFGRIMKEHALFLMTGFPAKNVNDTRKADWYRRQFEVLLGEAVRLAETGQSCQVCDKKVRGIFLSEAVIKSGELVTEYTLAVENRTAFLTGISIDSRITQAERELEASAGRGGAAGFTRRIKELNQRALKLIDGFIDFKKKILREMADCQLFTFHYPLLVEHMLREAGLYRTFIKELEREGTIAEENMWRTEAFWNRIMMEHALFIRGLLDPSEEILIQTADHFAGEYKALLEEARQRDFMAQGIQTEKTIEKTKRYRDFKAAGTMGITECRIAGLALPLLADHVLREANHYLRLLQTNGR